MKTIRNNQIKTLKLKTTAIDMKNAFNGTLTIFASQGKKQSETKVWKSKKKKNKNHPFLLSPLKTSAFLPKYQDVPLLEPIAISLRENNFMQKDSPASGLCPVSLMPAFEVQNNCVLVYNFFLILNSGHFL